jgi:exopolyphosphatase/guanosine-5'-triphosphate,3'-diphosphate pyrophosphatase
MKSWRSINSTEALMLARSAVTLTSHRCHGVEPAQQQNSMLASGRRCGLIDCVKKRARAEPVEDILAAIDVGTNAVRLELARVLPDGAIETMHQERDPVRPGEGLFKTGMIRQEVADRLLSTLRRYSALCRRYDARVKAVATSAVREAKNRDEIVRRARREAQLNLEVISGREEARLICLGVLHGTPPLKRSLCVDIGGGSTEVAFAIGEHPKELWSIALGAVRLTEVFGVSGTVSKKRLKLMRKYAREAMEESLPRKLLHSPANALGSSGTIQAVVGFARQEGMGHATTREVSRAVERLAQMDLEKRRKHFDPRRADIVVAGAVVLEAVLEHLKLDSVTAVDRGLRDGLLRDLVRRRRVDAEDQSLHDAAVTVGRRFGQGEAHSAQVARLALALFDDLAGVHQLPASARPWLEVAALLHDVGNAINYQRHHKHSQYLIQNADLPGLSDRERLVIGCIARFHRRSAPDLNHEGMAGLTPGEARVVRKCATLLRVADSFDRSHRQPIGRISALVKGRTVTIRLHSKTPIDLELWDAEHERKLFREVFSRALVFQHLRR